ncbi:HPr family phosphocarrier protein [bacterium]|nr:HPr family phosphocarrier protein [bacterium]
MAETQSYRREVTVKSEHGLHIRPCTVLAQSAMKFQSRIHLNKPGMQVDAKSILDLMTLAAAPGAVLELEVDGPDAAEAIEHLAALFDSGFAPTPAEAKPSAAVSVG